MKVAIIGNMNNNNFSLMRYFRNLGIDAHLFLNYNDGIGNSNHFTPDSDTWDIDKWSKFIHHTQLNEDPISVFNFPISSILFLRLFLRKKLNNKLDLLYPITKGNIKKSFEGYSYFIGSGITPAILQRVSISLDIYYPYAIGVEWLSDPVFLKKTNSTNPITKAISKLIVKKQILGIKKSKNIICSDKSLSLAALKKIDVNPLFTFFPMVYNLEPHPIKVINSEISKLLNLLTSVDYSILSHSRQKWVRPPNINIDEWIGQSKNNHWLIKAFAELYKKNIVKSPLLILFEYGDDVEKSKELCSQLGITKCVFWMKKTTRKEILFLLSKVDIGVGEFYDLPNLLFGGTGYEILSSGIPLIQGFNFSENTFNETYNIPPPPLLAVKKEQDVYKHLVKMAVNPSERTKTGIESKKWFDTYCGIGLAEKWLQILKN